MVALFVTLNGALLAHLARKPRFEVTNVRILDKPVGTLTDGGNPGGAHRATRSDTDLG